MTVLTYNKNYISRRGQFVQIGNIKLKHHVISFGIPHCSVMGPQFFNILIKNLKSATNKFDLAMYADDTTLIFILENFGDRYNEKEIEQNINK